MSKFKEILRKTAACLILTATTLTLTSALNVKAQQQNSPTAAFTPGNIVVYRVGNGMDSLTNTGNSVFLDEYTPTGTLVQSIPMPTTASGANFPLIAGGTATTEGGLTRSADGRFLLVPGYGTTTGGGTSLGTTTSAAVPRVVGRVDAAGNVNTSTALNDAFSAGTPRGVSSTNGTDIWLTGSNEGVRYTTFGATTSTVISNTVTNLRNTLIAGGQLYVSTGSGSTVRIGTVGTGTPTTSGQTITNLPGFVTSGSPYQFFFADLSSSVPGLDTLYVADDTTATGGIQKFSLVGGNWTSNGSTAADTYRGLTGVVSGGNVTLYATRKGGSTATGGGELVSLVDSTGYNATITANAPTVIATAAANTAFRGVALTPVSGNPTPLRKAVLDFNGDFKTDYVVARDSSNNLKTWFVAINGANTLLNPQWGVANDIPTPADFDGDGKTDFAVWRGNGFGDPQRSYFFILQSGTNTVRQDQLGSFGDTPTVVGDYDGDGKADLAVYRAASGQPSFWFYRPSATPTTNFIPVQWGATNDLPVVGDFDGDGKNDFVVRRSETNNAGTFYLRLSSGTTNAVQWGFGTDRIVPGDFDGDNKNDFCVARSNGTNWQFFVLTRTGGTQYYTYGIPSDRIVPGDYDGDGKTDIAVWRAAPSGPGAFYVRPAGTNGTADFVYQWGTFGDYPVAANVVQ
jgi:hypothetical protein